MSAMTEIPANTPKPMGSTESFVPGSWNAAALVAAVSAADDAAVASAAATDAVTIVTAEVGTAETD